MSQAITNSKIEITGKDDAIKHLEEVVELLRKGSTIDVKVSCNMSAMECRPELGSDGEYYKSYLPTGEGSVTIRWNDSTARDLFHIASRGHIPAWEGRREQVKSYLPEIAKKIAELKETKKYLEHISSELSD